MPATSISFFPRLSEQVSSGARHCQTAYHASRVPLDHDGDAKRYRWPLLQEEECVRLAAAAVHSAKKDMHESIAGQSGGGDPVETRAASICISCMVVCSRRAAEMRLSRCPPVSRRRR